MPTVNLTISGDVYKDFLLSSPITGVCRISNNGAFSIYVRDSSGIEGKIKAGETFDMPIVQGHKYTVAAMGDVSVDYTLIPA